MQITAEQETNFLVDMQRLLSEGSFVATYKYALLLALADISIERGNDTGETLTVTTDQIAEKFITYYWRQIVPYPGTRNEPVVLSQKTGRQAGVISTIQQIRIRHAGLLTEAMHSTDWEKLVRRVAGVVEKMPLWRLQRIGPEVFDFLYENHRQGSNITLKPGVVFCFRKYHPLISELVKGAWARYVRRFNPIALGAASDLHEFLFGSERNGLALIVPILIELQNACCFYCEGPLQKGAVAVDHFVPWSRYSIDLGHNFVLAHGKCNSAKSDHLAAEEHLQRWVSFQQHNGPTLTQQFERRGITASLPVSVQIMRWAYHQTFDAAGLTWLRGKELKALQPGWGARLDVLGNQCDRKDDSV